jgi:hypothetical protein
MQLIIPLLDVFSTMELLEALSWSEGTTSYRSKVTSLHMPLKGI